MQTRDLDWKLTTIIALTVLVAVVAVGRPVERNDEWRAGILSRCAVNGCRVNPGWILCREPNQDCRMLPWPQPARVIRNDAEWMLVEVRDGRFWAHQDSVEESRR